MSLIQQFFFFFATQDIKHLHLTPKFKYWNGGIWTKADTVFHHWLVFQCNWIVDPRVTVPACERPGASPLPACFRVWGQTAILPAPLLRVPVPVLFWPLLLALLTVFILSLWSAPFCLLTPAHSLLLFGEGEKKTNNLTTWLCLFIFFSFRNQIFWKGFI